MRYKKGCLVEVLDGDQVPSGSWRCAEIVSGNGRIYTVKYFEEAVTERVPRESIRPAPPAVEFSENLMSGDVVEVFLSFCWKMAKVSKVIGRNQFLVRLVGTANEFKTSKCNIRVRQSWQDDRWVVVRKGPVLKFNRTLGSQAEGRKPSINICKEQDAAANKSDVNFQESRIVSSGTLKRASPIYCSQTEVKESTIQKFRMAEKDGRIHRVVAENLALSPRLENVNFTGERVVRENLQMAPETRKFCLSKMGVERANVGGLAHLHSRSTELNDVDRISCSVGSSSIASNDIYGPCKLVAGAAECNQEDSSDAESVNHSCSQANGSILPSKEELAEEIHRLELYAYRCTIEALHASGPLSWEQESMITNLRISLHISNEEHLMELRNLIPSRTSIFTS